MKYAIVLKGKQNPNNPRIGEVKPYVKEENKNFSSVTPDDFPRKGSIFVSRGYENLEEKFDDNELFRIQYNEADFTEKDSSDPRYCSYHAYGEDTKKLSSSELFHIIDKNVDFEKRQILGLAYKPTRDIFVTREEFPEYLFGPFQHISARDSDGNYTVPLKAYPSLNYINSSVDWFILKVQKDKFTILDIDFQKIWLCSIQDLAKIDYDIQDFISNEQLVKWANNIVPSSEDRITKRELNKLQNSISYIEHQERGVTEARSKKLLEIFDKLKIWQEDRSTLIGEFLSTEKGKKSIDQYLDNNSQKFKEQLEEKYGEKEADLKKEISELDERKQEKEAALAELQNELEATKDRVNQRQQEELDGKRLELKLEVENLRDQRDKLNGELSNISKIEELGEEVKYLERKKMTSEKNTQT